MAAFRIDLAACPPDLQPGLREIVAHRADRFAADGIPVTFTAGAPGLAIARDAGGIRIRYGSKSDAFRALGRLLGGAEAAEERSSFTTLGAMVDVSRNGVLTVPAAQAWLRCCALLGINMLMLYSEDTYEVPGEPFFGYLRGRYTRDELRALDDYADALGIEMIPCIQTLAHLEQALQWPAYADLVDVPGVLLAEDDRTYALVEKLVDAASAPFRTKRIHLGMDEAWGLGTGRFKGLHGEKSGFDILNTHLARVRDMCAARGLRPMIWSDMYFRLASPTGEYYDLGTTVPPEVIAQVPAGVDLVYWDYYHDDPDFYRATIARHRALGPEPLVAGGGWTWGRLVTHLPYAFAVTNACMAACKDQGVREYFLTLWGDDGMECDVFTALPVLALVAEYAYAGTVDPGALAANFAGACDGRLDDFFTAAKLDYLATAHDGARRPDTMSKWLLWQDPLLAITDPNLAGLDLAGYYADLADALETTAAGGLNARLAFPAALARALAGKVSLRTNLAEAYAAGDRARLRALLDGQVAETRRAVDALWRAHRALWMATYRPFGWEVIELRYGGLRARLETLADRVAAYLDGTLAEIPELAVPLLPIWPEPGPDLNPSRRRVQTPSALM
jgi:hypothetical protein